MGMDEHTFILIERVLVITWILNIRYILSFFLNVLDFYNLLFTVNGA